MKGIHKCLKSEKRRTGVRSVCAIWRKEYWKLYTVLSSLGVVFLIFIVVNLFVLLVRSSYVYVLYLMCICCTMCVLLFLI